MDADAAITAVVSRLPAADVAALLAARGLPAVVHGGAPARARAALAAALKDDLCEWEWDTADAGDDDDASCSNFHADIASTNGALVSCGNAIVAVGGMDAARREHAAAWRWDLSPAAADAAGFAPLRPPRGGGGGDDLPPHYPAGMFAAAHAGEVWVFPGPGNADLNTAAALDPTTGAWRRVRTAGRPPGDDFIRRTVVGVATGGGQLWTVGGPSLDRAARFDFETRTWTRAAFANAPAPFVFGGAAWHANELWVYGAAGDDGDAKIGVWRVDPASARRAWCAVTPPPGAPPPPPFRLHSASAVVGDRWIVHGGRTHAAPRSGGDPWRAPPPARGWLSPFQVSAAAHEFSFASGEWRPLLADGVAAPAREWHAGLGLADCAVFVGGRTDIAVHDASPDILSTRVDVLWVKAPPPRAPPTGPAALAAALADVDACADAVLVAADGARVPATRAVLAAHSAVFRAMWGPGTAWAERGGGDVEVADVDGPTLRALVSYCHGALAELPPTMPALLSLFEAADKYDVAGLVSEVVAAAAARAAPADVAPLLAAAERRACAPLAAVCADVAAADLGGVLKQPSFVALCAAEPRAALGLVRRAVTRLGVPGCDDDDGDEEEEEEEREAEAEGSVSTPPAETDPATPARAGRPPPAPEPPTPDVAPPALAAEE